MPLAFAPGEAFQAFVVRAYLLQSHEMLFDAHDHAFRVLGGIPGRGIYDTMKTAVDRVGSGKARQVNPSMGHPAELRSPWGLAHSARFAAILHRLLDGKPSSVPTIDAPQALVLRQEPKADVERYDALRGKAVRHAS